MKAKSSLLLLLFIGIFNISFSQDFKWAAKICSDTTVTIVHIQTDIDGNFYIAGNFFDDSLNMDLWGSDYYIRNHGGSDAFIAKYSSGGSLIWAHSMGGSTFEECTGMVLDDTGNVFVCGRFQSIDALFNPLDNINLLSATGASDFFVAKYSCIGKYIWAFGIGGKYSDVIQAIAINKNNSRIYLSGVFADTLVDFDPGNSTAYLSTYSPYYFETMFYACYDVKGNYLWAKKIPQLSSWNKLILDDSSNIYIAGDYSNKPDFDPSEKLAYPEHNKKLFIVKYDSNGNYQWLYCFGNSSNNNYITGLTIDENDIISISGNISSSDNDSLDLEPSSVKIKLFGKSINSEGVFILKINTDALYVNAFVLSGKVSTDYISSKYLIADDSGNIYISGYFGSINPTDFDPSTDSLFLLSNSSMFLAKYNSELQIQYAYQSYHSNIFGYGSAGISLSVDKKQSIFIAGMFSGSNLRFDSKNSNYSLSSGTLSIFIAKYTSKSTKAYEELQNNIHVIVYPNPIYDLLTIKFNSANSSAVNISLYNVFGQIVYKTVSYCQQVEIDMSNYKPGVYVINISTAVYSISKKLLLNY